MLWNSIWQFIETYSGPGWMIAVGYLDPGNWATNIAAGSAFGCALLWVVFLSTFMAMLLQYLCIRLGVEQGLDLAEACHHRLHPLLNILLYCLAELAIVSCDFCEVLGTAIALKLLFSLPIQWGVALTCLDVLLLLMIFGTEEQRRVYGRSLEWLVFILMCLIGVCLIALMSRIGTAGMSVLLTPQVLNPFQVMRLLLNNKHALISALGLLGATVMPHNLYLHSASVKHYSQRYLIANDLEHGISCSYTSHITRLTLDSCLSLGIAMIMNCSILILSAALKMTDGEGEMSINEISEMINGALGKIAKHLFGIALLASGQSSTITGTIAGQVVFEGHLNLKMRPWLRRLVTRIVAICPAMFIGWRFIGDDAGINKALIYSQVVLSLQLPFAIVPLLIFTLHSSKNQTHFLLKLLSWLTAILIIGFSASFLFFSL